MIRLMKADLRRILRKKGFYIFNVLLIAVMVLAIKGSTAEAFMDSVEVFFFLGTSIGVSVLVLVSVYSDELHAGTMQGAIGIGMKRGSIVRAKFFDCAVLTVIEMLLSTVCVFILMGLNDDLMFTGLDRRKVVLSAVILTVKILSFTALSSVALYISWGVPAMLLTDVAVCFAMPTLLMFLDQKLNTTLSEIWVEMMLNNAEATMLNGSFDARLIAAAVIYIVLPLIISNALFRRKELEL